MAPVFPTTPPAPGALPWRTHQREYGYPCVPGGPMVRLWDLKDANGYVMAAGSIYGDNARLMSMIAEAVNSHDQLLRERDEAIEALRECNETFLALRDSTVDPAVSLTSDVAHRIGVTWAKARAVLSKLAPEGK